MKLKKLAAVLAAVAVCAAFTACSSADGTDDTNGTNSTEKKTVLETASPDKYTYYLHDYTGRNCASLGSVWLNQIIDHSYGPGKICLNLIADDGSYVDIRDENVLKSYRVTGQSVEPNTEIKLVFEIDENGEESNYSVQNQSLNEIDLYVTLINNDDTSVETKTNKSETVTEKSTAETTPTSKNTVTEKEKTSNAAPNGIRPEFKEALDSYEAFFDEYCDIMKKYMENPLDMSILTEYYEYIEKAEEMDEKLEALDDGEMSDEELKYYIEVTTRVTTKMLEIYQ